MKRLASAVWQWLLAKAFGAPLTSYVGGVTAYTRVHVFGSGPSAERTRYMVREGDLGFVCNHAVKWRPSWDCIFVETVDNSAYGLEQIRLLEQVSYGLIICKNNYPHHPLRSIRKIRALRKFPRLMLLPEYQASSEDVVRDSGGLCAGQGSFIFPQYASSILTMVFFAVRSGAREIWLHGADALLGGSRGGLLNLHATERLSVPFSTVFERVRSQLEMSGIIIKIAEEFE